MTSIIYFFRPIFSVYFITLLVFIEAWYNQIGLSLSFSLSFISSVLFEFPFIFGRPPITVFSVWTFTWDIQPQLISILIIPKLLFSFLELQCSRQWDFKYFYWAFLFLSPSWSSNFPSNLWVFLFPLIFFSILICTPIAFAPIVYFLFCPPAGTLKGRSCLHKFSTVLDWDSQYFYA